MEFVLRDAILALPPPEMVQEGLVLMPLEGLLRVRIPFKLHQNPQNRSMRPSSLKISLIGKDEKGDVFYASDPTTLWKVVGLNRVNSMVSSVGGDDESDDFDHQAENGFDQDGKGDGESGVDRATTLSAKIFQKAIKQGQKFVEFPFRIQVPSHLPPTLTPPAPIQNPIPAADILLSPSTSQTAKKNTKQKSPNRDGLHCYPSYEVSATLTFESFSVKAFQTSTAPVVLRCCYPSFWLENGLVGSGGSSVSVGGEQQQSLIRNLMGTSSGGVFAYSVDAPRMVWHGSKSQDLRFTLRLSSTDKYDVNKVSQINVTPVYRYKH
ncbi:hypothetical protein HDU76_002620, partial [Blyttiomyces sp. JEL0837]